MGSDPLPSSLCPEQWWPCQGRGASCCRRPAAWLGMVEGLGFGCPVVARSSGMAPWDHPAWISSPLEGQVSSGQGVCE